ncbi:MAG: glycosyltransferase family 4 protein [Pyrinomonadaceae bacterium]|nr:glycosyltransferase family 4 protein [Pyrinomonadaceae bacterium]
MLTETNKLAQSSNGNGLAEGRIHVLEIIGNAIVGGMERYALNLVRQLPSDRFHVTCVCPFESAFTRMLRETGSTVFITPLYDDPPWRSIQLAVEVVQRQQIDLIHAHLTNAHVLAGLTGSLTRTPVVATMHGMQVPTLDIGVSRMTGTHLIVVCQEAYTQALGTGVPPERLTLIPNGVDTEIFTPERSGESFRLRFDVPVEAPVIGFVGRLAWEKGPDNFLRVADLIHRARPDVHFVMVGEGSMEKELLPIINQFDLEDHVHMAGLYTNMCEAYAAFDIFAMTSRSEGMPFALLEAMACGRPVVSTNVGGVIELIEAGSTGVLVDAGDWEEMAATLLRLLDRPARLEQLGQAGRKRVEEFYDFRTSVGLTTDLFQRQVKSELRNIDVWRSVRPTAKRK